MAEEQDQLPEQQGPSVEVVWRQFRNQQEKCADCGVRLKWDEQGVRGRAGAWVVAEPTPAAFSCICFKCLDHVGPKLKFYFECK